MAELGSRIHTLRKDWRLARDAKERDTFANGSATVTNDIGSTPFWLGYSLSFWDAVGSKLLLLAIVAGVSTTLASGVSSFISSAVTSKVQGIAGDRITVAELELQKSKEQTALAYERIGGLDAAVAEANARGAEATKIAEEERLARVKIEAGLASRRITSEQASKLTASLARFKGELQAINVTIIGDKEAFNYGSALVHAIQDAGVHVNLASVGEMIPPRYGLIVVDTPDGALHAAFKLAGISRVSYAPLGGTIPGILVGLKPPSF